MPTIDINPTGVRADRLQAMTTFVAAVETGGLASAARKLDLSPPLVDTRRRPGLRTQGRRPKGTLTITAPVMFGQLYVTPLLE
jgi:DNA-binding transcriptional LysR family regulator